MTEFCAFYIGKDSIECRVAGFSASDLAACVTMTRRKPNPGVVPLMPLERATLYPTPANDTT